MRIDDDESEYVILTEGQAYAGIEAATLLSSLFCSTYNIIALDEFVEPVCLFATTMITALIPKTRSV
jgi:hypothetical protein